MIPGEKGGGWSVRMRGAWVRAPEAACPRHCSTTCGQRTPSAAKARADPSQPPPVRPGVTYPESDTFDTKVWSCAGAPREGHRAASQPGAVGCRHQSTLLLEAGGLFLVL